MKASRVLLLCLVVASCLPSSGVTPAQTMIANPAPQLAGTAPASPFVAREAAVGSVKAPTPAMSSKTKTWLLIGGGAVAAVILILLLSGGNGYSTGGY